jgi:putative addiction module component (TIGR02574 family)
MNKALRDQVLGLPADEKFELMMDMWESIPEDKIPLPTDEQLAEAERRLDAYQRDASRGEPADEVMKRIRAHFE